MPRKLKCSPTIVGVKYVSEDGGHVATIGKFSVRSTDRHTAGRAAAALFFSDELKREVPFRDVAIHPCSDRHFDGAAAHVPISPPRPLSPTAMTLKKAEYLAAGLLTIRQSGRKRI